MEVSQYLATVEAMHAEARRRGLFFQTCEDERLEGRQMRIGGQPLLSFTSCSYLGLEYHPALIEGVKDAVTRFGTQFSSSRGYVSAPQYREVEELLSHLFGGYALVTPSTTLAHQIALPVLATEKDAIVFDNQAHHSVQVGTTLARAGGAAVEMVRHRELERSLELVRRLAQRHRTVWFACDGVYSMYGDLAPVGLLSQLLDLAPNVRIYVDDAHGMSWAGEHGRGSFLSRMPLGERIVLSTSFAKAFGAGGGCLVFASEAERERVRTCGGPLVFSGPMQPPMLGAVLASTRIHLSEEIAGLQREFRRRVDLCNHLLRRHDLPLLAENESPIFFLRLGLPRVAYLVAERLKNDGLYVNVSMYPTVPMKRAGIRLSVTNAHTLEEIERVVEALARHIPQVLAEEGVSREELDDLFAGAVPAESLESEAAVAGRAALAAEEAARGRDVVRAGAAREAGAGLVVEHHRTIAGVDRDLWDRLLGGRAACSWEALALTERVFQDQPRREHNWRFHYLLVRTADGAPVCATFFTHLLHKDDMLMRDEVSRAVEDRRREDPYFLTSEVLTMGSLFSEGNHLYLDRQGPWREALRRVLEIATREYERSGAEMLLLRDLPADDPEMDAFLLEQGFVKTPMLDSHHLDIDWDDEEELLSRLVKKRRYEVRRTMAASGPYRRQVYGARAGRPLAAAEADYLHELYRNVAARKLRLNVFEFPRNLIPALAESPAWEVVALTLDPAAGGPADGRPVAWYGAHVLGTDYAPLFCGLDYRYVEGVGYGAYRQLLLTIVRRARELGMRTVHLGMDADVEKARFGTRVVETCVYSQARDHFHGEVLREIVAEIGLAEAGR